MEASAIFTGSHSARPCCSAHSRARFASARIAAITHSAIARSRAPRALHRVTPAGIRPTIQSTPAESTCTTLSPVISSSAGMSSQRGTTNSTSGVASATTSTPGGGGPSAARS